MPYVILDNSFAQKEYNRINLWIGSVKTCFELSFERIFTDSNGIKLANNVGKTVPIYCEICHHLGQNRLTSESSTNDCHVGMQHCKQ